MISRRSFLTSLVGLVAAPAIVKYEWIMPVKSINSTNAVIIQTDYTIRDSFDSGYLMDKWTPVGRYIMKFSGLTGDWKEVAFIPYEGDAVPFACAFTHEVMRDPIMSFDYELDSL